MAKSSLLVVTAVLLAVAAQFTPSSGSGYWDFYCAGANFTAQSQYGRHLDAVAAVLPGRAASSPLLFADETRGKEAAVHAIAMCRGDSSRSRCERCVTKSFEYARKLCGFSEGAFVFRDWCTLGYYSRELVLFPEDPSIDIVASMIDDSPVIFHSAYFDSAVLELAHSVARSTTAASSNDNRRHFGTGQKGFGGADFELDIYALAQCLPSLSPEDCDTCLGILFDTLLSANVTAGRAAKVWCSFRFAPQHFFRGKPMLELPINGSSYKEVGQKHKRCKNTSDHTTPEWAWWVLGALGVVLMMNVVGLSYWCMKTKKRPRQNNNSLGERQHAKEVQCKGKALADEARPSALDRFQEIVELATGKEIVLFLDYDGTLSPIVNDPEKAFMSDEMHRVLQDVARLFKTSIVSGRARAKVFEFVGIDDINYAGSHGLDIKLSTAGATTSTDNEIVEERGSYQPAEEHLATITEVYNSLLAATKDIKGASVESNKYCVSVHYRNVATEDQGRVREVVDEVLDATRVNLNLTEGKMVYEVRPPTKWNKGDAVLYLLEHLGLLDLNKVFPIYIGDDTTDEDAFKVLLDKECGAGILVSEASKETNASYSLKNPPQVMSFLDMLVQEKRQKNN